jgi:hypothetical protein
MLVFSNMRVIEEAPMDERGYADVPWLAVAARTLSPSERAQLAAIVRLWDATIADDDAALAIRYATMAGQLRALAECPIEWWDVLADGVLLYRIWLCAADAGYVFDGDSNRLAPGEHITRGAYYGDGWQGTSPGSPAEQFEAAQAAVLQSHPKSELAGVAFVNR